MQISISFPTKEYLDQFIFSNGNADYNYSEIGRSSGGSVVGYDNDQNSALIGKCKWGNSKTLLNNWQHFPSSWTKIYSASSDIRIGQTVGVLFKLFGVWWINAARIIYIIDEPNKYGFAYGTLAGHVERGEECFWIERDATEHITYHIKAFSKPDFWGARLLYPLARKFQRRFVKDSMAQMQRLCKQNNHQND